jgi:hypothetical protein
MFFPRATAGAEVSRHDNEFASAAHTADVAETSGLIGPDVIVAELYTPNSYGSFGGVSAYAAGTTSCNAGDTNLWWYSNTNHHPVIAQNLFRLKNGRLEQLGQSWLKHGFTALTGNACGFGCQPPGTGQLLGVGCSDPYSAFLNGDQDFLGPKSEVNAFTGDFLYPPVLDPPTWNLTHRRLQAPDDDVNPALNIGAEYFVEGQYVTPDDAAAGNQDNNVSYRKAVFAAAGSTFNMSLSGSTTRQKAAITAWRTSDPSVQETQIRIPNEGLMMLAAKVTDLGDGFFGYEYAVQNINSDRSARSFSVPIAEGATVRNIGFRDVPYHSGEPYDGTDWGHALLSGVLVWSTATHAVNPNANALRWGTMYNFRFEADVAPQPTIIALGLFKPGTPATVEANSVGPFTNVADCNNNGKEDGLDVVDGTSQDCNNNGIPDECEEFAEGTIKAELVVSGLSSPVFVASPPGDLERLFIVEQGGTIRLLLNGTLLGTPFLNITSKVRFSGEQGLLSIAFDPDYATNGRFYVNYTNLGGDTVVARYERSGSNENVANATSETILKQIDQDFANHNGGQLQFGPDGRLYVGMGDGGSGNDPLNRAQDTSTLLGKMLRLDTNNPPTYVPADNPFVGGGLPLDEIWAMGLRNPWRFSFDRLTGDLYIGDVGQNAREEIDFNAAGTGAGGNYGWRCMEGTACTGLSGCTCDSPTLTPPILEYSHADGACSVTGGYVYRGCAMPFLSGTYFYADFCAGFIRSFRMEDGSATDLRDRTAELSAEVGTISSVSSFGEDAAGEMYIVSLGGSIYRIVPASDPVCGNGDLEGGEQCDDNNTDPGDGCDANCMIEPGNAHDHCSAAQFIVEGTHGFNNNGANTDGPAVPGACGFTDPQIKSDLWYCYRPSCTGTATVSACGSSIDTAVAVYDGCSCPTEPSAVACNDDSCGTQSVVSFPVTACGSYLIQIGHMTGTAGNGMFEVNCDPDPIAADCNHNDIDDAVDIACGTSFDLDENEIPDECETGGDAIAGGRLYDRWWAVTGTTPPGFDHPLWQYRPDQISNMATGAETWRCQECHGWDYRGVDGPYGSGPHRTGFPGIVGVTLTAEELFDLLKEPPINEGGAGILNGHDYGTVLSDQHILDLAAFALLPHGSGEPYINNKTAAFVGDPTEGQTNFESGGTISCITCHGADGTNINFGTFEEPEFIGTVAVEDPWKLFHKIRFGQPGAPMPSWLAGGGTNQGAADIGRYAQLAFPTECVVDEQCADAIGCTQDTCDAAGRCVNEPLDGLCPDNGVFCDGPEVCDSVQGCVSAGNPCATSEDCNEAADSCGCGIPVVSAPGSRYILVTPQPTDSPAAMALLVSPDCPGGTPSYVGFPSGPFNVARLVDNPNNAARLTAAQWGGTVLVTGIDVVPDTAYLVQSDCGPGGAPVLSEPAPVETHIWGDVTGVFSGGEWTAPDGIIQATDALAILDGFRQLSGAPPMHILDSLGCSTDQIIDVVDVLAAIDGFTGDTYEEASHCPVPCP